MKWLGCIHEWLKNNRVSNHWGKENYVSPYLELMTVRFCGYFSCSRNKNGFPYDWYSYNTYTTQIYAKQDIKIHGQSKLNIEGVCYKT